MMVCDPRQQDSTNVRAALPGPMYIPRLANDGRRYSELTESRCDVGDIRREESGGNGEGDHGANPYKAVCSEVEMRV